MNGKLPRREYIQGVKFYFEHPEDGLCYETPKLAIFLDILGFLGKDLMAKSNFSKREF